MKAMNIPYKGKNYSVRELSRTKYCEVSDSLLRIRINDLLNDGVKLTDAIISKCFIKKNKPKRKPRDKAKQKARNKEFIKERATKKQTNNELWTSLNGLM